MSRAMHTAVAVDYPYRDGRPMAESDAQLGAMLYLLPVLRTHFAHRPDVYVGGDMFVYYERGNPEAVVAPDVFVVVGAAKREANPRLSYRLWEEPKGPDFVLEVVSRGSWPVDRGEKRTLYARLGVSEYWLYDPTGEHLGSRLRGMRLEGGRYRDLAPETAVVGARTLRSAVLGLDLRVERGGRYGCTIRWRGGTFSATTRSTRRGWRRRPARGGKPWPAPPPRRRWRSFGHGCVSCGTGRPAWGRDGRGGMMGRARHPSIGR